MSVGDWEFVAGYYCAKWDGVSIGSTKEGFKIRIEYQQSDITVDEMGATVVDQIQNGKNVFVDLQFVEYEKILDAANAQMEDEGDIAPSVGQLLSVMAAELILLPKVRTGNNQAYKFFSAIPVDNIEWLLSTQLREGPITFRCLPFSGTDGTYVSVGMTPAEKKAASWKGRHFVKVAMAEDVDTTNDIPDEPVWRP